MLQYDKQDPEVYGLLGVALMQKGEKGDIDNALPVFREGLRYTSDRKQQAKFHSNIGHILLNQRHFDSAEEEFRLALSQDWNNPETHFDLALAYIASKELINAQQSLRNVLQLNPKHKQSREMLDKIQTALKSPAA